MTAEAAVDLYTAVLVRCVKDAQQGPGQLPGLAEYLGVDPRALGREIKDRRFVLPFGDYVPRACSG